jgi:hypothetical protein
MKSRRGKPRVRPAWSRRRKPRTEREAIALAEFLLGPMPRVNPASFTSDLGLRMAERRRYLATRDALFAKWGIA